MKEKTKFWVNNAIKLLLRCPLAMKLYMFLKPSRQPEKENINRFFMLNFEILALIQSLLTLSCMGVFTDP